MTTKYIIYPWAILGDKTAIPDATDPSGYVSWQAGWGADYARDPSTDPLAKDIERDKTNQALYVLSSNVQDWQVHSFPEYITAADNGGVAYAYDIYAIVRYDSGSGFKLYQNITAANTNVPTGAGWVEYGVAGITHASTSKTTPVDADEIPLVDSAASNVLKKLTWANLKATINAYIATIYAPIASPTFTGTPAAPTPSSTDNSTTLITSAWAKIGLSYAIGGNGYIRLPTWMGGITIQWGYNIAKASGYYYYTLPVAFISGFYSAVASAKDTTIEEVRATIPGLTQIGLGSKYGSDAYVHWIAIGR